MPDTDSAPTPPTNLKLREYLEVSCVDCVLLGDSCQKCAEKKEKQAEQVRPTRSPHKDLQIQVNLTNLFTSGIVIVKAIAKDDKKTYYLHEGPLRECSQYFAKLLDSNMSESRNREVDLDLEDDGFMRAFSHFVELCYVGDFNMRHPSAARRPDDKAENVWLVNVYVYALAERLVAVNLKKLALKKQCGLLRASGYSRATASNGQSLPGARVDIVTAMINLTYQHTPSGTSVAKSPKDPRSAKDKKGRDYEDFSDSIVKIQNKDPMRMLVAAYAASLAEYMRTKWCFVDLIEQIPEVAVDMMNFVGEGRKLIDGNVASKKPKRALDAPEMGSWE